MRIVLDTNIYIAVALQGEFSEELVDVVTKSPDITLVTSEEILLELESKLREKFHWAEEDIDLFIAKMKKLSEIVRLIEKISDLTRDPRDTKILECALAGNADLIVSSDQDLIKLKQFRGIGIIHPKTLTWTFPQYFKKTKQN